LSETSCLHTKE